MKKSFLANAFTVVCIACSSLFGANTVAHAEDHSKVLYIYNWTEYIPQDLLKNFTQETGIEVRYSTYESNEVLYSKLKLTNGEGYDLVFPSSYYVQLLAKEHLIQKIDKSRVNMGNIIPGLLNRAYDPKNEYSIPYMYGFTGIGVNTDSIPLKDITSWRDLWSDKYQNIILLDDVLDDFSMALLSRGVNPNTATKEQIMTAYDDLSQLVKKVVQFNSDAPETPYIEGAGDLGMIWSGSAFKAENTFGPNIHIVYPKEGAILWIDNFAIPAKCQNIDGAYKFINFILRPENALKITQSFGFQTSNDKVKVLMPKDWQTNPALFPSAEVYQKAIVNNIPVETITLLNTLYNKLRSQ